MKQEKFSLRKRFKSFVFAISGIRLFFQTEHNAWIHAVASIAVLILAYAFALSGLEWIALLFCIALVLIAEMINTTIEKIMDHLSPQPHHDVKVIKDMAAAAVLTAAVLAIIIGLIIFIPKILS